MLMIVWISLASVFHHVPKIKKDNKYSPRANIGCSRVTFRKTGELMSPCGPTLSSGRILNWARPTCGNYGKENNKSNAQNHHTRHERTRYVSSRNQIYGGNFDYNEKYIPFVHYWERPLQVLESSMKIPKKLSSRPLFSWDLPVQITSHSSSKKTTTESPVTEKRKEVEAPDNPIPILKSRSGRAKALAEYPESLGFIPTKKKKSSSRKKSIESIKLKEFTAEMPTSVKMGPDGKIKRKKKGKKSRKSKKNGKRLEGAKEMNDELNEVRIPGYVTKERIYVKEKLEVRSPCEGHKCEHQCKEANGKAVCICFRGFAAVGNKCQDINECETNNGGCNGKCLNTLGSRKCICSEGFRLVDDACADVNECLLRNGHGPCQDKCINTLGSYYCTCNGLPGTKLSSDKHTCEENNECNLRSAGCSHSCFSISGRAYCTCPDGMDLGDDWKTCHDIDECSNPEDYNVDCKWGCVNTIGSYACMGGNGTST